MAALTDKQDSRKLRAATLIRVSTLEQADRGRSGLSRQRDFIQSVVTSKSYDVVHRIEMIDVSGTATGLSPEVQELVELVKNGEIDVVVCSEMSRLIRPDDLSSLALLDIFKARGVPIDCGGALHDFSSPEGFLSGGLQALLGGHERMQMLRKMLQSKEAKRAAGKCPSSQITLPIGLSYCRKTETYFYNDEISLVAEAFRLVDEEGLRNYTEIGKRIGGYSCQTIRNMLRNRAYIGVREYTQKRDQSKKGIRDNGKQGDRPKIERRPDEIIKVRIFPKDKQAVSDERFERVQKIVQQMSEIHARRSPKNKGTLLAGIGRCGFCGERFYSTTSSRRNINGEKATKGYYICKSKDYRFKKRLQHLGCCQKWIRKEILESVVDSFVLRLLEDKDFTKAALRTAQEKQRETLVGFPNASTSLRRKLDDLRKRDRRVVDAIEAGVISIEEGRQRRLRLEEEKKALELVCHSKEKPLIPEPEGLSNLISQGSSSWARQANIDQRRNFLKSLFSELYFQGSEITAFRLSASIIDSSCRDWYWATQIPISLCPPFRKY